MYQLEHFEEEVKKPWERPLAHRVKELIHYKSLGFQVAAYLYFIEDSGPFRYRVYNMCHALHGSVNWRGVYFFRSEVDALCSLIPQLDILVLARLPYDQATEYVIFCARKHQVKIVFEIDDLIFSPAYIPMITESGFTGEKKKKRLLFWEKYSHDLNKTALSCDAGISTNSYLGDQMAKVIKKPVYSLNNFYNKWQETASDFYYQQKRGQKTDGRFTVGYFSGSPTHYEDFLKVVPALVRLLQELPDLYVNIVGYLQLPEELKLFEENKRICFYPYHDFVHLQQRIAEVDVNIIPLADTPFTNCKSELKYFEASIVGTPSCASPAFVYRSCIEHGKNGYLCETDEEWYQAVLEVYHGNAAELVKKAREDCILQYSYQNQQDKIQKVFDKVVMER